MRPKCRVPKPKEWRDRDCQLGSVTWFGEVKCGADCALAHPLVYQLFERIVVAASTDQQTAAEQRIREVVLIRPGALVEFKSKNALAANHARERMLVLSLVRCDTVVTTNGTVFMKIKRRSFENFELRSSGCSNG